MDQKLRILKIVPSTVVDGPGVRTSVYFAGCKHHCKGCHNPESWDMLGGQEKSINEVYSEVLQSVTSKFNPKVTLTGGDPLYQKEGLESLLFRFGVDSFCRWDIWLYTGFTFEEMQEQFSDILDSPTLTGVVCDPFILEKRDIDNYRFRGSSNQRVFVKNPDTKWKWTLWEN